MTAINILCQPRAAIMLTDTAVTDADGRLISTASKVLRVDRLQAALAWTGFGPIERASAAYREFDLGAGVLAEAFSLARTPIDGLADQSALLQALPAAVRAMYHRNRCALHDCDEAFHHVSACVALVRSGTGLPEAWFCTSDPEALVGLAQYTCVRLVQYLSAHCEGETPDELAHKVFGRSVDYADPASFAPARDGLRLLEAQRSIRLSAAGQDFHSVGGAAELTRITSAGITQRTLHKWPDRIGQPIRPDAEATSASRQGIKARLRRVLPTSMTTRR